MDAGAQSPKETWLRLLLIRAGLPRPHTQIPVLSPDGNRWYYLDMGWEGIKLAANTTETIIAPTRAYSPMTSSRLEDLR